MARLVNPLTRSSFHADDDFELLKEARRKALMLKKTLTKNVYDCRANDLLNIVADVKSYTNFIPFCSDVEIYDRSISDEIEFLLLFYQLTLNSLLKILKQR